MNKWGVGMSDILREKCMTEGGYYGTVGILGIWGID
jgi:hypothetical protein